MEKYLLGEITRKLHESGLILFTTKTLQDVIEAKRGSAAFNVLTRLMRQGVIRKIERDKYVLGGAHVSDFQMANFLYESSYVSFETALNFWGVLSQFPYEISSASINKTRKKQIDDKLFSYAKMDANLFWGFVKQNNYLIATPEKALLDQMWLSGRGTRQLNAKEYDLERIDVKKYLKWLKLFPKTRQFNTMIRRIPI